MSQNDSFKDLLEFRLKTKTLEGEAFLIDRETGEIKSSLEKQIIDENFINEPLYLLWHTIFSIQDIEECKKTLSKNLTSILKLLKN